MIKILEMGHDSRMPHGHSQSCIGNPDEVGTTSAELDKLSKGNWGFSQYYAELQGSMAMLQYDANEKISSSKTDSHNQYHGPRFDNRAKDGFYLNSWNMNVSNLLIDSPDMPIVTPWIDWENISTGPIWDITYPVMNRFLESINKYYSSESDDESSDGENTEDEDDSAEPTEEMNIAMQLCDEMRPDDNRKRMPGERSLNKQKGKLLVRLGWINLDVEEAKCFINLMTNCWVGCIWVKDVQDPDNWQGRRRGSRCTKHQSDER
jgi:hypothetical protein